MHNYEIVMFEKIPCVKYTTSLYDEPKLVHLYWPIGTSEVPIENIIGKKGEDIQERNGTFNVRITKWNWKKIFLKDGMKTESIFRGEESYTPPKTKLEVRYHNGRWQKLYKSGWR